MNEVKDLVYEMVYKYKITPDEPMMNMILENCF